MIDISSFSVNGSEINSVRSKRSLLHQTGSTIEIRPTFESGTDNLGIVSLKIQNEFRVIDVDD